MKKQALLILLLAIMPVCLFAHAPKAVNITYDSETGILQIEIEHPVKDVSTHYISKVEIFANDEEINVLEFTEQSSPDTHVVKVELEELEAGTEIVVNATCNKMGAKKGSYTVE